MSVIKTRGHQLFPVLDGTQIDTARRFASGPEREFAPGEIVYNAGERDVPAWLVLKGSIAVVRRDGLDHETAITTLGPGQFSGEVSQLAGAATLASASAGPEGCTALPFDATHVRALMIGSADIGEIMMRAFILRRVGLIEEGGVGAVLVGRPGTPELVGLQGFLGRNGYLHRTRFLHRRRSPSPVRALGHATRGSANISLPKRLFIEAAYRC